MVSMSPAKPRPAAMSAKTFAKLLKDAGLGQSEAARVLGVHRHTVIRWLDGTTPIAEPNALLIRERLTAK